MIKRKSPQTRYTVVVKVEIPVTATSAKEAQDKAFGAIQTPGLLSREFSLLHIAVYKRKVYCEKCRWLGFMAMGGTGMLGTEHYDICSHTNSIDKYPPDSPQSTKNKNNDCKDYGEKNDVSK